MAWISVHQQVQGAKLRTLSKRIGCSRHEALGILVTLWMWGLDNADQSGLIAGADEDDIADGIAIGLSKGITPQCVVEALIEVGWLDKGEDRSLRMHDWDEWQAPWYKYKEKRQKDIERKRAEKIRKSQSGIQGNSTESQENIPAGLGSELTDEDIKREREIVPGIEAVCKHVGMGFGVYDEAKVLELLNTYPPEEISTAISKAADQGKDKLKWSYIIGILKRGGGKDGGSGDAERPAAGRSSIRGNGNGAAGYNLESTRV